ncbi:unnamed protein product [Ectocarpus sp. CCAP 1310/34]|nr:unnamed protein product [Ectocarpus sp. CCAP 1310/34]
MMAGLEAVLPQILRGRKRAMDLMQNDPVLMERVRAMLDADAAEQAAAKVAAIDAANTRALRASLQALKQHCNSSIGWTTYQTALAVAAGAGEHTSIDTDVCHPGQRCKPFESGGVSLAERANSLGIRRETFSVARRRMPTRTTTSPPRSLRVRDATLAPTLDQSMWEKEDEGREEVEEGEEEEVEGEREEAQYVRSRGRVRIAKKRFPEVG